MSSSRARSRKESSEPETPGEMQLPRDASTRRERSPCPPQKTTGICGTKRSGNQLCPIQGIKEQTKECPVLPGMFKLKVPLFFPAAPKSKTERTLERRSRACN